MGYQRLLRISDDLCEEVLELTFIRQDIFDHLMPPKQKAVIVRGPRGVGKTTVILQFLNIYSLDSGSDDWAEQFGSPLTQNSAWLR